MTQSTSSTFPKTKLKRRWLNPSFIRTRFGTIQKPGRTAYAVLFYGDVVPNPHFNFEYNLNINLKLSEYSDIMKTTKKEDRFYG